MARKRTEITGHAFLHRQDGQRSLPLNTGVDLTMDDDGVEWGVLPLVGSREAEPVASESVHVTRYMRRVVDAMERATPRPVRAVPKPVSAKKRPRPAGPPPTAELCPACAGEAFPGCQLCAGVGAVPHERAREWRRRMG